MAYTVDAYNVNSPLDSDSPASNVAAELRALKTRLNAMQAEIDRGSVPIGTIISMPVGAAKTIDGYIQLPTVSTVLDRTAWSLLFAAIGTRWGAGDGVSTFGLPYVEDGSTLIRGATGTTTNGEVIDHTHPYYDGYFIENDAGGTAIDRKTSIPPSTYTGSGDSDEDNNTIYERLLNTQVPSVGGTKNIAAGSNVLFYIRAI
jgi:hypothetical protein